MADDIFGEFLGDSDIKVSISEFKGKNRVDIRKYWDDKGEMKPSPKGVSMTLDQFKLFLELLPKLEEKISQLK